MCFIQTTLKFLQIIQTTLKFLYKISRTVEKFKLKALSNHLCGLHSKFLGLFLFGMKSKSILHDLSHRNCNMQYIL